MEGRVGRVYLNSVSKGAAHPSVKAVVTQITVTDKCGDGGPHCTRSECGERWGPGCDLPRPAVSNSLPPATLHLPGAPQHPSQHRALGNKHAKQEPVGSISDSIPNSAVVLT